MGRTRSKQRATEESRTHSFDPKRDNVLVADRIGVANYLAAHPSLGRPVNELCEAARQTFGRNAELSLKIYRDPESDDQYLTLYVRLEEYNPDVLDRIESVSRQFGDALEGADGHVLVTTDFRRPGGNHGV